MKCCLVLTCSANCAVASHTPINQSTTFAITDTKLCVPVVTLSTDDNVKLLTTTIKIRI